jgi:ADP-heptose:LPS heptosyltransferase
MKILFITSNRLGDGVLSTCVLNSLVQRYPTAQVTIAGSSLSCPLFEDCPQMQELIIFNKRNYALHWLRLWRQVVATAWDMVVDLRGSALAYGLRAKQRIVWQKDPSLKHRVEQLWALLDRHNIAPYPPTLWLTDQRLRQAQARLAKSGGPVIAVAPVANWVGKEWAHEKWVALLLKLRHDTGPFPQARFLLLCAPNERAKLKYLIEKLPKEAVLNWPEVTHLLDTAALIKQTNYFIGNDSGLMHLSAALGQPTLGLFGPSPDVHYRPWGQRFIRTKESYEALWRRVPYENPTQLMDSLRVEEVYQMIQEHLSALKESSNPTGLV